MRCWNCTAPIVDEVARDDAPGPPPRVACSGCGAIVVLGGPTWGMPPPPPAGDRPDRPPHERNGDGFGTLRPVALEAPRLVLHPPSPADFALPPFRVRALRVGAKLAWMAVALLFVLPLLAGFRRAPEVVAHTLLAPALGRSRPAAGPSHVRLAATLPADVAGREQAGAALAALGERAARCLPAGTDTWTGKVELRFDARGRVVSASPEPPSRGEEPEAVCVANVLRDLVLSGAEAPFDGSVTCTVEGGGARR